MSGDAYKQGYAVHDKAIGEAFHVRSEELASLRQAIASIDGMARLIGPVARTTLVIDANIVLRDLIWLTSKRRDKEAQSWLMETISAGTIVACIPPFGISEIAQKIPYIAERRGIDEEKLWQAWDDYKSMLTVEEPNPDRVMELKSGRDPDDADYIALADTIGAKGILSHDKDIAAMGGTVFSMDVVGHLKDYSRAAAIEVNIRFNGIVLFSLGVGLLSSALEFLKEVPYQISRLPNWAKAGLIGLSIFFLLDESSRQRILDFFSRIGGSISGAITGVLNIFYDVSLEHHEWREKSLKCLDMAAQLMASLEGNGFDNQRV